MSQDLRNVFDTALPDDEPPLAARPHELAAAGRRVKRRHRIGMAASGATVLVTVLALLLVPTSDQNTPSISQSSPPTQVTIAELAEQVRQAMNSAFPDAQFSASAEDTDEPFDLTPKSTEESSSVDMMVGYGKELSDRMQLATVELHLPGGFSTAPSDKMYGGDDDIYLIDCGSGSDDGEGWVATECHSEPLGDESILRTARLTEFGVDGYVVHSLVTAVLYRDDDTAVVLRSECGRVHDPENENFSNVPECDDFDDSSEPIDPEAAKTFVLSAPKIPQKM